MLPVTEQGLSRVLPADRDISEIYGELDRRGWALLPGIMKGPEIDRLLTHLHRLCGGLSQDPLKPFEQVFIGQLPELLESWGRTLRLALRPLAHRWTSDIGYASQFSPKAGVQGLSEHANLRARLSYLFADQMQELRHHSRGQGAFPVQLVVLLSDPGQDFTGGELVITDQRPTPSYAFETVGDSSR